MAKKTTAQKKSPAKKTPVKKHTAKKPNAKKAATPKAAPKRGLGRGLSALMEDVSLSTFISDDVQMVDDIYDSPEVADTPIMDSPEVEALMETLIEERVDTKEVTTDNPQTSPVFETKSMDKKPRDETDVDAYPEMSEDEKAAEWAEIKADMVKKLGADPETGAKSEYALDRSGTPASDHNIGSGVTFVEMGQLERNPEQPRRHFDSELLRELTDSIRQKGILQPILVRPLPGKERRNKPVYQIVAGERRWQAAMSARLDAMPVFVREITDQEALEIGVIENVQRAELNPMEEAMAYKALTKQFGRTQEDVAKAVGKSRSYVANMMRLINLPEKVQDYLAKGDISTGHARAIIAAPDPTEMADAIVENNLSVRDAEDWARKLKTDLTAPKVMPQKMKGADERRLEAQLMDALGLSVDLKHRGPGGEVRVKYKTVDQLDEVVLRLMGKG